MQVHFPVFAPNRWTITMFVIKSFKLLLWSLKLNKPYIYIYIYQINSLRNSFGCPLLRESTLSPPRLAKFHLTSKATVVDSSISDRKRAFKSTSISVSVPSSTTYNCCLHLAVWKQGRNFGTGCKWLSCVFGEWVSGNHSSFARLIFCCGTEREKWSFNRGHGKRLGCFYSRDPWQENYNDFLVRSVTR